MEIKKASNMVEIQMRGKYDFFQVGAVRKMIDKLTRLADEIEAEEKVAKDTEDSIRALWLNRQDELTKLAAMERLEELTKKKMNTNIILGWEEVNPMTSEGGGWWYIHIRGHDTPYFYRRTLSEAILKIKE